MVEHPPATKKNHQMDLFNDLNYKNKIFSLILVLFPRLTVDNHGIKY